MDSPTDLFDDSAPQIRSFAPSLASSDLPGVHPQPSAGRPPPAFRPPGFPLIHHLLQPSGGAPRRMGAQLNPRHLEEDNGGGEREGLQVEGGDGGEEGGPEGEDGSLVAKRRRSECAEWSQDLLKVKRMKLEEEGGRRRGRGREGRRREREELKEQLEEARERLQALQEKVWRAFGEKHIAEEEKKRGGEGGGDVRMMEEEEEEEEEDVTEGMYDEEDIDGGEMEKETFSLLSDSPFESFTKRREERKDRERGGGGGGGGGGGLNLEGVMEGAGLWLDCEGVVRGDWMEEEGEEGGQKFAQALKLELGSAVARVIDRVLRLYSEMTDFTPPSPPAAISFEGGEGGQEREMWMGLLTRGRGEEKGRGSEKTTTEAEREKQVQKISNGGAVGMPPREPSDAAAPLAVQRSPDIRKTHPLLAPPLSSHPHPHPHLPLHHPSLPRPPPLSHPPLLPPSSQPKDLSSSSSFHPPPPSSSSSASSFPHPPPPLPLPLLHYSMQQLFSRSLHHPQLPHLPPSRKDFLGSDPFLDFSSHPSSHPSPHPSFPPLNLLGHLDPGLARHAHGGRERERGVRGDGGMRGGGGGLDGGELYLTAGGISFYLKNGSQ